MTAAPAGGCRVLQRTVFPVVDGEVDHSLLPLYADAAPPALRVLDRRSCRVAAGHRVSFGAYANAFPAAYWRHWTAVELVDLELTATPGAAVEVLRSDADGSTAVLAEFVTPAEGRVELTVPLKGFDDGGWVWFSLRAGGDDVRLGDARWTALAPPDAGPPWSVTVGITTYDRVESCAALVRRLAGDDDLRAVLDQILVVDQGTRPVAADPVLGAVQAAHPDLVRVVAQPNLGGSGGFARAQWQVLHDRRSDAVVLLDDDVVVEPEGIRRAVAFAALCRHPTIVGGQMLSTLQPTRLHALGEVVERRRFWWRPAPGTPPGLDLARRPLPRTPVLHRRTDVDYNGWWLCLLPRAVLERVGLALPLFLKWDDAEYGLRAGAAGFPTVTLPGIAVWHVPWSAKNDLAEWPAYFHHRNRVIAALLHSPYRRGGWLVGSLLVHQAKSLLARRYAAAATRVRAVEDVERGPQRLHRGLGTARADVERVRTQRRGAVALAAASLRVHARLYRRWPRLTRTYRAALTDLASPRAWEHTLALGEESR